MVPQIGIEICIRVVASLLFLNGIADAQVTNETPDVLYADTLTISSLLSQVLERNDRLAASRLMIESAREKSSASGAWTDPMLMVGIENLPTSFDVNQDPMTMKTLGLSWELPYSGRRGFERKASFAEIDQAAADSAMKELEVESASIMAFYQLYFRQTTLERLVRQHALDDQLTASAHARFSSNLAGQDEVLALESEKWRHEAAIINYSQELIEATIQINALRGNEDLSRPVVALLPDSLPVPTSPIAWLNQAEKHNPELIRLQGQSESLRLSAQANKRMSWPMIELRTEYGFRSGSDIGMGGDEMPRDDMVSFGANVSLPLFNGRSQKKMAHSMVIMSQSVERELSQRRRELYAELTALFEKAIRIQEQIHLYENRILPASEDALRIGMSGYSSNRTPYSSVIQQARAVQDNAISLEQLKLDLAMTLLQAGMRTGEISISPNNTIE
ncbi:MAG: TolC family protein [candidate division Zixibacteria bacterium]|nr:TolC family protein [candidate division Zixibacteria bacterium]